MKKPFQVSVLALALGLGACYHATVETGLQPSGETVKKQWAHSFLYGLVPPSTIETAAKCPSGVARVETRLSFLNQLANILTFGIYTPMTIEVECAAVAQGGAARALNMEEAGAQSLTDLLVKAVELSQESGAAVYIETR